jgi:hypothetical protein
VRPTRFLPLSAFFEVAVTILHGQTLREAQFADTACDTRWNSGLFPESVSGVIILIRYPFLEYGDTVQNLTLREEQPVHRLQRPALYFWRHCLLPIKTSSTTDTTLEPLPATGWTLVIAPTRNATSGALEVMRPGIFRTTHVDIWA